MSITTILQTPISPPGSRATWTDILLDYDSGGVEGVDELDQTCRFRAAYAG